MKQEYKIGILAVLGIGAYFLLKGDSTGEGGISTGAGNDSGAGYTNPQDIAPPATDYKKAFTTVTNTGTYQTDFPISQKIIDAMMGVVQPAKVTYGGSSPQAAQELKTIATAGFSTVGVTGSYNPSTGTAYTFAPQTATVEKKIIQNAGFSTTGVTGSYDPSTGKITTMAGAGKVSYTQPVYKTPDYSHGGDIARATKKEGYIPAGIPHAATAADNTYLNTLYRNRFTGAYRNVYGQNAKNSLDTGTWKKVV